MAYPTKHYHVKLASVNRTTAPVFQIPDKKTWTTTVLATAATTTSTTMALKTSKTTARKFPIPTKVT